MNDTGSDIFHARVESGVAIAWVNGYSAVVVKTSGVTVLFDPVGMNVPTGINLDLIAITHGHTDHWEPGLVADIQSRTGSTVGAPPALASKLAGMGARIPPTPLYEREAFSSSFDDGIGDRDTANSEQSQGVISLLPGDEFALGGTTINALRCDHAAVEPLAFQVRSPDGVTVYLPGDTTPFPEMGELPFSNSANQGQSPASASGVDVLCWMGTALTDGAEIAKLVQPKVFLSYAITPPAAGTRAYNILTGPTPDIPFVPLERHQVFRWPGAKTRSD